MSRLKKNKNQRKAETAVNNYNDWYLRIIKTGVYLTLFLPLVIIPWHLYLFQFGKVIIFRIIIEIIALFYFLLVLSEPKYRPRWGLFEASIALFILIYFLTSLAGVNFWRSFWGTVERMGGFFSFIHYWAFFIIASSVFKSREEFKKLFSVSIFVAAASSVFAVMQSAYFGKFMEWLKTANPFFYGIGQKYFTEKFLITVYNLRPFGAIGNAGLFAAYILFNVFLGMYLLLYNNIYKKSVYLAGIMVLLSGIFVSGTRSVCLAVIIGFFAFISVLLAFSSKGKTKLFAVIAFLFLFITIGYVWVNKDISWVRGNYYFDRLISTSFESDAARVRTWNSAKQAFGDKPLLGWGPENFNAAFNKYFNPLHFIGYGSATWFDRAHNVFFEIITTMGAVGLASYISIFVALYYLLLKNYRRAREDLAVFDLVFTFPVVYFVYNIFWFDDFSTYLMLFLFFAFSSVYFAEFSYTSAMLNKVKKYLSDIAAKHINLKQTRNFILNNFSMMGCVLSLAAAIVIYYGNIKPWIFHNALTAAAASFQRDSDNSFDAYKDVIAESAYLGRHEAYKRFGEYVLNVYTNRDFKSKEDQKKLNVNLKFAISELENAVGENPRDAQVYLLLGRLYNKYYSFFRDMAYLAEAEKILRKGLELSPKRQTLLYEYGQVMVFKKDYAKAVETFRYAKDLYPDVAVSHWYLGMSYANFGQYFESESETEKASEQYKAAKTEIEQAISLDYAYQANIKDIFGIVPVYAGLKDYKTLEKLYNEALQIEPDNAQIYVYLALVYKELGNKEKAREMTEKSMSLDPIFIREGKKFIEELK